MNLKECLSSEYFITIFSVCFLIYLPGSFVNMNYKSFVLNRINDDSVASLIATTSCLSLILGRIFSGYCYDSMKIMDLLRYFCFLLCIGHILLYNIGYSQVSIMFSMMIIFFAGNYLI